MMNAQVRGTGVWERRIAAAVLGGAVWPVLMGLSVIGLERLMRQLLGFRCEGCGYLLNPNLLVYGVLPGAVVGLAGLALAARLRAPTALRALAGAVAGVATGLILLLLWIMLMAGSQGVSAFAQGGATTALIVTAIGIASGGSGLVGGAVTGEP